MEINLPTASPFFSGLPNQIMYCISTPNLSSPYAGYNGDQKKIENSQVVANASNQYYYNTTVASNPTVQMFTTANVQSNEEFKPPIYDTNLSRNQNRFFEEEGRNFECSVCHKKFRQKGTLQQHERIHLDMRPYPCTFQNCDKRFRQKAILTQHMRTHCDASAQLIFKNLGNNGILWPQNVPYPDEIKSGDEDKVSLPQIIHSVFGTLNEDMKKEESNQKSTMPLYVRCPICQQEFKQKSTLVQRGCIHIESRPYSCLVVNCGRRFRQQSHLQQHNRIHENLKPYECAFCKKFFRQRTILNQHLRLHTNEKPYRCMTCFKNFRQQAILSSHEKSHMGLTLGCPLTDNCKRRFASENDLRKHIESHMNPSTKPKKQSTAKSISNKPEIIFSQSYPPMYFNQSISSQ